MSVWTGIKIWGITVFINALAWLLISLLTVKLPGILLSVIFLFGGLVFSMPLLLIIIPLVYFSCKLPYSFPGKIYWLGFYLMGLLYLFFKGLESILGEWFTEIMDAGINLVIVAWVALVVSLYINRAAIIKLDNEVNQRQPGSGIA